MKTETFPFLFLHLRFVTCPLFLIHIHFKTDPLGPTWASNTCRYTFPLGTALLSHMLTEISRLLANINRTESQSKHAAVIISSNPRDSECSAGCRVRLVASVTRFYPPQSVPSGKRSGSFCVSPSPWQRTLCDVQGLLRKIGHCGKTFLPLCKILKQKIVVFQTALIFIQLWALTSSDAQHR